MAVAEVVLPQAPLLHGEDPAVMARELEFRKKLKGDFMFYAPRCLRIKDKYGAVRPFTLNRAQRYIHMKAERQRRDRGFVRIILLKGRQQGASTYIEGRAYHRTTNVPGTQAFILTHEAEATQNLFKMAERYHENCPPMVRPKLLASNAKELRFGGNLDSGYKVGTAGNRGTGRSQTMQYFHGSEVAFWPHAEEHAAGALQAVPKGAAAEGTEVWLESTANGIGNYFHQQWLAAEKGESEFEAVFVPWFWEEGYQLAVGFDFELDSDEEEYKDTYGLTDEQMAWRRAKIVELGGLAMFQQEYPANPVEAFRASTDAAFINVDLIAAARAAKADPYGPRVLGVDPARFGDDATCYAFREGRKVHWIQSQRKQNLMSTVGHVVRLHRQFRFHRIFVDVIGLGAGVVDRLREVLDADIVSAVNFAEAALDDEKWANKRAECWGEMREWLKDKPADIPDSDSLASDLGSPQYKFDSKGRWVLEKKEDMKKRLGRSPDEGDSVSLTFAEPVAGGAQAQSYEPDVGGIHSRSDTDGYESWEPEW